MVLKSKQLFCSCFGKSQFCFCFYEPWDHENVNYLQSVGGSESGPPLDFCVYPNCSLLRIETDRNAAEKSRQLMN